MNLNQLYAGNDYAYHPYEAMRGRAKFHPHARRVRLVRAFKKFEYNNTKATGFAEVLFLDNEGEIVDETNLKTVKARYILCTWEEHEDERERRDVERRRYEREAEERRQTRMAEQQRILAEQEAIKEAFYSKLDALGISRGKVTLGGSTVTLNKTLFTEMLDALREKGFRTRDSQPTSSFTEQRSL